MMGVALVGAGPGDPGLLTVRGAELLAAADVVLYDSLAEESLLDLAPPGAERRFVGKRPGAPMPQDEINELLIAHARAGRRVVRLKGGDPFVFGRGGEEAEALAAAGVAFEVVPGVSSAVAVPAYAGIPVTHRGLSTSFTVVTGHSRHAVDAETNWEALAEAGGTIVVLMGVAHRGEIAKRLMDGGLPPHTPVAAVRWGTRPEQRTARTTLDAIGGAELEPPAVIVIGAVAGMDLSWYESRPLFGRRVVVTRAREQASEAVALLRDLGAEVVELPMIEFVEPADGGAALREAAGRLAGFDWVVFTSANAVERLFAVVRDARAFGAARVAVVGAKTAEALARHGVAADLVPPHFVAEALLDAFPSGTGTVLLPRAEVARDVLPDGLGAKGWQVEVVDAYRTVPARPGAPELERAGGADAVMFSSSSTVKNFLAVAERVPPVVACIGPVTARAAEAAGLHVDVVADESTVRSLVDALARRLGG
jgi:uroporphyrinogen III methyltransferase/synthase